MVGKIISFVSVRDLVSFPQSTLTFYHSVEPTAVGEMITLQPGESWEASAEMKALSSKL